MKKIILLSILLIGCNNQREQAEVLKKIAEDCPIGGTVTIKAYVSNGNGITVACRYEKTKNEKI